MTDISKINLVSKTLEEATETIGHLAKIIIKFENKKKNS
ncbi:Uncharacterised protein [Legionella gratiana]|uniref:Uncharacterized protein n=1 Tax=Legionella gratiana TaxID=45066 RepID=A0A378JF66_9GAMM|nr:Uncharacterised protein [Legionella gratiana]